MSERIDEAPPSSAWGEENGFRVSADFSPGEVAGGLSLGPLEAEYQGLFAEALEDGVITSEERARLDKAADNLGLDRQRLLRLEQAMVASYETRHRVRVVEHYEEAAPSLSPIDIEAAGDSGRVVLLRRIETLETRVRELEEELRAARAQINVEVDLSELDAAAEDASEDLDAMRRHLRRDPTRPETLRALYRLFDARGDADARWRAAQALVAVGAATPEETAVFDAHRTRALIAPLRAVTQEAWQSLLFHPEEEVLTGQIFGVIAPAVLVGRVTALRRDRKLHVPSADNLQDPQKATIMAVRALQWGATLLGLAPPPIYVDSARDAGYEHIPAVPPISIAGRRVLSGRSHLELAFLAGRHLTGYRQEHFVKTLFSSVPDLEDLFLAALIIGSPRLPIAADMKQRVTPIARAIEPLLEPPQMDALRASFMTFVEEGGRTNLQRWSAAADKTACRVGMLLCGDLPTACGVLQSEEGRLGDFSKDLLLFTLSDRYGELRKQLGIAVGGA